MVTTRNRASKTAQSGDNDKEQAPPQADTNKGAKRKRETSTSTTDQGDHTDIENEPDKSRVRLEPKEELNGERKEEDQYSCQQTTLDEPIVCSCRHDVMQCIGILPSLPIMNQYYDSDDSESDLDDCSHTVLPIVDRNSNKQHGGES